jgi:hypothetical protein
MSKAYPSNLPRAQSEFFSELIPEPKSEGRKRFMMVDTLGLVLRVLVTAADVGEREGGRRVLKRVKQLGKSTARLTTI